MAFYVIPRFFLYFPLPGEGWLFSVASMPFWSQVSSEAFRLIICLRRASGGGRLCFFSFSVFLFLRLQGALCS